MRKIGVSGVAVWGSVVMVLAACGGGGDGGTTTPPAPAPVASVSISLAPSSLIVGSTATATVVVRDARGAALSGRAVMYSSSSPSVAVIDAAGVITTFGVGTSVISASSEGRSGDATLTVLPVPVATVNVAIGQPVLSPGASTAATVVLRDAQGAVLTGRAVTWSSSAPSVASVDAAGVMTGVSVGTASISASSEGRSGAATVTVQQPPVATVTLNGAARVKVGDSYTYVPTLRLGDGTMVNRPITWSIVDPTQAVVTQSGVVTALQPGAFTIRLVIDGTAWTSTYAAYDWETQSSGSTQFVFLKADNTITNRFGTTDYSELIVSCGSTGAFFVWVRTPHVITANGLVAMSFDGGAAFSETWDELSPNFTSLWKRGSNATVKLFALNVASARSFGFAFGEFQGTAKAMQFRVGGLSPRLTPLFALCPSNAVAASASAREDDFAAQRRAVEAVLHQRDGVHVAASQQAGVRSALGQVPVSASLLTTVLRGVSMGDRVHAQEARRQR
ncbi:MAG: Ig-like domain-containing protein [Gemmatimonadaceae bacterium]|nr:Ig-like domain-containing protein [Gemmatimonadaceae bacterium]